jgi:hypothetical protein
MKGIIWRTTQILLSLFLMSFLFGCAPFGSRLYTGESLPRQDVAILLPMTMGLTINWVRDEKEKTTKELDSYGGVLELLPGHYTIGVTSIGHSSDATTVHTFTGFTIELNAFVKANHVYIMTWQQTSANSWKANIIDLEDLDSVTDVNDVDKWNQRRENQPKATDKNRPKMRQVASVRLGNA